MQGYTHTQTNDYFTIGTKIEKKIQCDHPNFITSLWREVKVATMVKSCISLSGKKLLWKLVQRGRLEQEKPGCPLLQSTSTLQATCLQFGL